MNSRSHESAPEEGACTVRLVDGAAVEAARDSVPAEGVVSAASAIFSALSDPTRLRILLALAARELCVCDLAAITGVTPSGVSHQLRLLRDRGLVSFRRDGKRAVYRLADEHVATLLQQSIEHAEERL